MDDLAFKSILDGLEANRVSLDHWLGFWTWLVVIGVACELIFIIWDHVEEKREWQYSRTHATILFPSRPSKIELIFELLSVALVVIGVVGELRIDAMLGQLETNIRDVNEKRALQLEKEAGSAAASAKMAHDEADAVSKEAEVLGIRLVGMKKDLDFQAPRRSILLSAAPKIVGLLKQYAGQRVGLYACDSSQHDLETMDTWGTLANILAADTPMGLNKPHFIGAGWKEVPSNLNIEHGYCNTPGIQVLVSQRGTSGSRKAARALGDALLSVLPASIYNNTRELDPDAENLMLSRGFAKRGDAGVEVVLDPQLVAVVIGAHPVQ